MIQSRSLVRADSVSFGEFIVLAAFMMSLVALAIDAMLPAMAQIGQELGVHNPNDSALIISLLILGLAFGQLLYGPLSDAVGRKPAVYLGLGIFAVGSMCSLFATSFEIMLTGRVLQGFGLAGPRVVSIALIRDRFSGAQMAKVMSFVMVIFIIVPAIAPALGQGIVLLTHWRYIFLLFVVLTTVLFFWLLMRQPETLLREKRIAFSLNNIIAGIKEALADKVALPNMLAVGLISGAFIAYLNLSQQIFQGIYRLGELFPLFFAVLALAIGFASMLNSRLVTRYGMKKICFFALAAIIVSSGLLSVVLYAAGMNNPGLAPFTVYMFITLFCIGLLFGNLNAMAMEPLGHIAGIGSSIVGFVSNLIGMLMGTLISQLYNGLVVLLVVAFGVLAILAVTILFASHSITAEKSE